MAWGCNTLYGRPFPICSLLVYSSNGTYRSTILKFNSAILPWDGTEILYVASSGTSFNGYFKNVAFINGSHFVVPPTNGCFNSINIIAGIRSTINLVQTVANSSCLAGYFPSNMEDNGCRSNLRFFLILFYFPECAQMEPHNAQIAIQDIHIIPLEIIAV